MPQPFPPLGPRGLIVTLLTIALANVPAPAAAEVPRLYEALRRHNHTTVPIEVPEGGLRWSRDTATWTLEAGRIWLRESVGGMVTGLVFEGRGRFRMTVPDAVERRHLGNIGERPGMTEIDEPFGEMVLRTTDPFLVEELPAAPAGAAYEEHKGAAKRHEKWLTEHFHDADARVLAGLHTPGDAYLRADMDTGSFGWLTYEYDDFRREEIQLHKFQDRNDFLEIWISLDRPEDRREDGRPGGERHPMLEITHAAITADITAGTHHPGVGLSSTSMMRAAFGAEVTFTPLLSGPTALQLYLSPLAEVRAVRSGEGAELPFVRDHIGGRDLDVDRLVHDPSLVVLLDRPLVEGEERRLTVLYEMPVYNYVSGRSWYPNLPDNFDDPHTAEMRILARPRHEVRAVGRQAGVTEVDGGEARLWRWLVERPTKMVSFSFGERFQEAHVEAEGVPAVTSFGPQVSLTSKTMMRNVAADIINSLKFYQWLFDSELPVEHIQATGIAGTHGQAFEGFLHMSEYTFAIESRGAAELFRGHEVAHQWWGHEVGWRSYRDQWLSEAFAEYSAMMFIQATMKKGQQVFEEILRAYTDLMLGSQKTLFSKFARPSLNDLDLDHRQRLGPIGLGTRASTCEMPGGYILQTYHKGALVLHMLRTMLRGSGDSDELFLKVLRDFVATHRGGAASTDDFIAVLSRHAPADWSWFFDQWIHGTAIPTYLWDYTVGDNPEGPGKAVFLTVEQRDVPEGFKMAVPVEFEFPGGKKGTLGLLVSKAEETFTIPVPIQPTRIEFNPRYGVLARVNRK